MKLWEGTTGVPRETLRRNGWCPSVSVGKVRVVTLSSSLGDGDNILLMNPKKEQKVMLLVIRISSIRTLFNALPI